MSSKIRQQHLDANLYSSPGNKAIERICYTPIGIIHSPFKLPEEAPRQPELSGNADGVVKIFPRYAEALEGIDQFSKIVLVCHLHLADPFTPKVVPRNAAGIPRGVFSTRAPARPNPIGISVVQLIKVEKAELYIRGLDFIEGTPVLDIKPYYQISTENLPEEEKNSNQKT